MNDKPSDFTRRDFLRGGSLATMMSMLGGVELFAQTNEQSAVEGANQPAGPKVKIGLIGLGPWGREVGNTLARLPQAEIAAVCDSYAPMVKRGATIAPNAQQTDDYNTILANKDITAVVIATATHEHKNLVIEALAAGKHVYCEAPLAHTIEDARAIAKAAAGARHLVFQAGYQMRSDPQRHFMLPFIRSGAIGQPVMTRAQWHRKTSWRATSPNSEREKAINWRLDKDLSLGLAGEIGSHAMDQAAWFLNAKPVAITGFGSVAFWKDGREVPDTVQAMLEFSNGVNMVYTATLANSFDAEYEILYGSDAAVMMRESKAWMFKEVDAPLLGWEVYARKETFYKETGISLIAGASKSVQPDQPAEVLPFTNTQIYFALGNFLRNVAVLTAASEDFIQSFGDDDKDGLAEHLSQTPRQPAASYLDGYMATVMAIKANEAVMQRKRIEIKPDLYELT
jgi:predicted dehydrogenase